MVGTAEKQVDLHVHQPRQQREVAEVELDRVSGHRSWRHVDDAVTGDQHLTRLDELALVHVQQAGAQQMDGRLWDRRMSHASLLRLVHRVANSV